MDCTLKICFLMISLNESPSKKEGKFNELLREALDADMPQ